MTLKVWFLETRPQFLLLPVVLAVLGIGAAAQSGFFHLGHAFLSFVGLLLAHISVNTLNDYFDYRSGLDLRTRRTPFSGGSGMLPGGTMKPSQVLAMGLVSFAMAFVIGVYFTLVSGALLLPLLIVAAFCILAYTPWILKSPWPEWSPGLGLGILPVLGLYFVQTSGYNGDILITAVPSGILVHNLLFLNEFPDAEADVTVNRKTLPVTLGKKTSAHIFAFMTALVYVWIVGAVIIGSMPLFCLIGLLTLPLAVKAVRGTYHYDDMARLMPGLGANVMVVLLTQLLLGIGFILAAVIG